MKTYICGCVRNCERYLEKVFENIRKIGGLFDAYEILIVYDDSTDGSYETLMEIKQKIPFKLLKNEQTLTHSRVLNISGARNTMLNYIRNAPETSYDYFIMMDMDDINACDCNPDVLKKYLNKKDQWDSLSFNRRFYYDIWALSIDPFYVSCWHWADDKRPYENPEVTRLMHQYITAKLNSTTQLVECASAFNGFAIYKTNKFIQSHYDPDIRNNMALMPPMWIEQNAERLDRKIYINWVDDCEHRYFHMKAVLEGGAKIRIAPDILFDEGVAKW